MVDARTQREALEALQAEAAELRRADDTLSLEEARAFLAELRAQAEAERDEAERELDVERARIRGSLARRGRLLSTAIGTVPALVVALLTAGLAAGIAVEHVHPLWPLVGALVSMVAFGRYGWRQGQRDWAAEHAEREQPD